MTWRQLVTSWPQGRNGVWCASFDGGKVVSRFPWALQLLCAALLNGYAGGRGVIFAKGAVNIFSWSKSWACVALVPGDQPVDTSALRTGAGGVKWTGPLDKRPGICDTVAAVAGSLGVT